MRVPAFVDIILCSVFVSQSRMTLREFVEFVWVMRGCLLILLVVFWGEVRIEWSCWVFLAFSPYIFFWTCHWYECHSEDIQKMAKSYYFHFFYSSVISRRLVADT